MARVQPLPVRYQIVPHGVMGMLIFVVTEAMLFAGLMSAFVIVKGAAAVWPPPNQPRLPIEETALNSAALLASGLARSGRATVRALLASGAFLYFAGRIFREDAERARLPMAIALALGVFFVGFQGAEWVGLIQQGLTLTSSTHGAFFYLIVGIHGLHAVAAILALTWVFVRLTRRELTQNQLAPVQIFWYFVVGVWPILYWLVYL